MNLFDLSDLSDLPAELRREVGHRKTDDLENQIIELMRASNGRALSLNQILVALYRKFKIVKQRNFIRNKLYRMSLKELVVSVKGRRGVYIIPGDE